MRVVGGPCGQPLIVPNSKVLRGWSIKAIKWRFEGDEELPASQPCGGGTYRLQHGTKGEPLYVYDPDPEPEPVATPEPRVRQSIIDSVGTQRFWRRRFGL